MMDAQPSTTVAADKQLGTSYDEVPYPSHPYAQSHPDNLATVARLFGMNPTPVPRCRVLEIGCAAGGNLIPMADCFPDSRFVGIDLSRVQLAEGQQLVEEAGLTNIELRHLDLAAAGPDLGQFDYILCHGVYSWVSPPLREKILEICRDLLVPQGVAYVSYNTYPGWHLRGVCRAIMSYHARRFQQPPVRVAQARALLDFLAESIPNRDSPYGMLLKQELDLLRKQSDSYLFHDHLEDVNDPVYFYEFAEQLQKKGLQYLGEARVGSMWTEQFPSHVQKTLKLLATDIVQMEQYMDFLRNRTFRQTLLCHENVRVSRTLDWTRIQGLYVAADLRPEKDQPDLESDKPEAFIHASGHRATTDQRLVKATLITLAESWPRPVLFEDLIRLSRSRLAGSQLKTGAGAQAIGEMLLQGYATAGLEFHTAPAAFVTSPGERPRAGSLVRAQAKSSHIVTTCWRNWNRQTASCFRRWTERTTGRHWQNTLRRCSRPASCRPNLRAERKTFVGTASKL